MLSFYLGKETKKPKETKERGEIKEETEAEIQTTSKTNCSKHEQKDPSQFPFSEEKSSLPLSHYVAECSSLVTLGILFVFFLLVNWSHFIIKWVRLAFVWI